MREPLVTISDPEFAALGIDEPADRQREVVRTAHEVGCYDVPRDVSTGGIAAERDVDPSTVAEHLQRDERNLRSPHLSSE